MYNVRLIEYPEGMQVRVYSRAVSDSDDIPEDLVMHDGFVSIDKLLEPDKDKDSVKDAERSFYSSLNRTKNNIYYIARSNVWEWFVTLTIDGAKLDRYDFKLISGKVRKWFDNLKNRKSPDLYYMIVPEQHKDGAWHFHGLLGGCDGLCFADSGKVDKSGKKIYNFENWKFGFSTATAVQDSSRVSSYICKYVTKTLCEQTPGLQRYWASKNCKRADVRKVMLEGRELAEFRMWLLDHMSWKGGTAGEFLFVDYYEIPKISIDNTTLE